MSHEPPSILWRYPTIDLSKEHQDILRVISQEKLRRKISWNKIRRAVARIDCWNRDYRRPQLKRHQLKIPKISYYPKPYDTWNNQFLTPQTIQTHLQRVKTKSKIDTWSKIPYIKPISKTKIFHRPIRIQGKARIDTWLKLSRRTRSTSVKVCQFFCFLFCF